MDRPHPLKRKALKPCPFLVLVNLDLPAGTICTESARDFVLRKAKIHKLHPPYLYQMSNSLVKENLSSYSQATLFVNRENLKKSSQLGLACDM